MNVVASFKKLRISEEFSSIKAAHMSVLNHISDRYFDRIAIMDGRSVFL